MNLPTRAQSRPEAAGGMLGFGLGNIGWCKKVTPSSQPTNYNGSKAVKDRSQDKGEELGAQDDA